MLYGHDVSCCVTIWPLHRGYISPGLQSSHHTGTLGLPSPWIAIHNPGPDHHEFGRHFGKYTVQSDWLSLCRRVRSLQWPMWAAVLVECSLGGATCPLVAHFSVLSADLYLWIDHRANILKDIKQNKQQQKIIINIPKSFLGWNFCLEVWK